MSIENKHVCVKNCLQNLKFGSANLSLGSF